MYARISIHVLQEICSHLQNNWKIHEMADTESWRFTKPKTCFLANVVIRRMKWIY